MLGYVDEYFRAVRATDEVAEYFEVELGDPVLAVTRIAYNRENVPIEYCENYEFTDVNAIWVKSVQF